MLRARKKKADNRSLKRTGDRLRMLPYHRHSILPNFYGAEEPHPVREFVNHLRDERLPALRHGVVSR